MMLISYRNQIEIFSVILICTYFIERTFAFGSVTVQRYIQFSLIVTKGLITMLLLEDGGSHVLIDYSHGFSRYRNCEATHRVQSIS